MIALLKTTTDFSEATDVIEPHVYLNKSSLPLLVGGSETLTASTEDTTGTVVWASSAEAVATVKDGVVTAVTAGTATITRKPLKTLKPNAKLRSSLALVRRSFHDESSY